MPPLTPLLCEVATGTRTANATPPRSCRPLERPGHRGSQNQCSRCNALVCTPNASAPGRRLQSSSSSPSRWEAPVLAGPPAASFHPAHGASDCESGPRTAPARERGRRKGPRRRIALAGIVTRSSGYPGSGPGCAVRGRRLRFKRGSSSMAPMNSAMPVPVIRMP